MMMIEPAVDTANRVGAGTGLERGAAALIRGRILVVDLLGLFRGATQTLRDNFLT